MKRWVGAALAICVSGLGRASAGEFESVQLGVISDQMSKPNPLLARLVQGELSTEFRRWTDSPRRYFVLPALRSESAGGLELTLLCFTYPEKSLLGEVSVLGSGGPTAQLVRLLVARAVRESRDSIFTEPEVPLRREGRKRRAAPRPR